MYGADGGIHPKFGFESWLEQFEVTNGRKPKIGDFEYPWYKLYLEGDYETACEIIDLNREDFKFKRPSEDDLERLEQALRNGLEEGLQGAAGATSGLSEALKSKVQTAVEEALKKLKDVTSGTNKNGTRQEQEVRAELGQENKLQEQEEMNPISFDINSIERANKVGHVKANIRFHGSGKSYTYIRKPDGENSIIIDGCKVKINPDTLEVESIERIYNTSGERRRTSADKTSGDNGSKAEVETEFKIPPMEDILKELGLPKDILEEKQAEEAEPPYWDEAEEVRHEKYDQIKMCLMNDIPVYLSGPAGSGKNYTIEQIAIDLGWEFYFSNAIQQEYKLTGFIDAGGRFHDTEFYKACTSDKHSVFFLDEIDASIPEVLVLLNAAIANGYFEFPNGRVDFDKVHFVAAGNTYGSGSDELYTGRMVLDQATLDRFAIIEFDYSLEIEKLITKGNKELIEFVRKAREEVDRKGVRATFSYRCMIMVTALEEAGMDLVTVLKIAVFKGLDKDTVNTIHIYDSGNKYADAFNAMKAAA